MFCHIINRFLTRTRNLVNFGLTLNMLFTYLHTVFCVYMYIQLYTIIHTYTYNIPGMLILVLKDSLRTFFKSLSLSWSLGVRSLSLSLSLGVRVQEVLVLVLGGQVLVLILVLVV